jgi:hypothetical protein
MNNSLIRLQVFIQVYLGKYTTGALFSQTLYLFIIARYKSEFKKVCGDTIGDTFYPFY